VAWGISGNIFENQGSSWKFVDCMLILNKYSSWTTGGAGSRWTTDRASAVAHRRTVGTAPQCEELTAAEEKGGGDGSDPHRLQKGAAEGQK
jgi:hypothetical protein